MAYNDGIPTMPYYQVQGRSFAEMFTPQAQIMWLYAHLDEGASTDYVDEENAKQDAALNSYQAQMIVTLAQLRKDILAQVDGIAKIGTLWSPQVGASIDAKQAVRNAHKDACALHGASVGELGDGLSRLMTVEALASSGLNVYGMAAYARAYSRTGQTIDGTGTAAGYPYGL